MKLLLLAVALVGGACASAQDLPDEPSNPGVLLLPTSNLVQQSVQQLREQIRTDQAERAADTFQRLSTADPSLLLQSGDPNQCVPLYHILAVEFDRLPQAVRTAIREASNQPSRAAIAEAIRDERWKDLVSIIHRFPGSDGAHLARILLAQAHLDRGHETAARHWLLQLSDSSSLSAEIQQSLNVLNRLIERRQQTASSNDDNAKGMDRAQPPEWHVRWKQQENVASQVHQVIERTLFASGGPAVFSWNAAIRDGQVFRRTLRGLTALDLHTGEPNWAYRLTPNHLQSLSDIPGFDSPDSNEFGDFDGAFVSMLLHDGALNTIHVGRQNVYAVVAQQSTERMSMRMGGRSLRKRAQLVAVSRRDGRRQWTVGGPPLEPQFPVALSNTWFAGPPGADGNLLYGIVEQQSEIRLVTLKQHTGEVLDSTVLAFPDATIGRDAGRSLVAATPVTVGGLILCPTTTGWLIAVDQLTHTVVWATRTGQPDDDLSDSERDDIDILMTRRTRRQSPQTRIHVFGSSAVVIPWDSQQLLFLDLPGGIRKSTPDQPNDFHIIATTSAGLIVGMDNDSKLQLLDVDSHEIVWECEIPEFNGTPLGTGVVQAGQFSVGTSAGALLTLDVETGAILSVTPDMLPPSVPGALFDAGSVATGDAKPGVRHLVFVSPDQTICLTTEKNLPDSQETSARVARLVGSHEYEKAWNTLVAIPEANIEADRLLARLRFEAAFGLVVAKTLPDGIELQGLAVTDRQRRLAQVVTVSETFAEQPKSAATAAIELATDSQSWSPVIPSALLVNSDITSSLSEQALLSTGSWVAHLIEQVLNLENSLAGDAAFVERLHKLPTEVLIQIQHHAVADVIRSRLLETDDAELAVHLMVHLSRLSSASSDSSLENYSLPALMELPSWEKLSANVKQLRNPAARQTAIQRILSAVGAEEQIGLLSLVPAEIDEQDHARPGWDELWIDDDYTAVPFARPQPSRRSSVELQAADCQDSVLSTLTFKLHRNPERLSVQSAAADPAQIWSVTGSLPVDTGTVSSTQVSRFGSIALLQSSAHLVAVSLLDQRVLWQYESMIAERRNTLQTPNTPVQNELPAEYPGLISPQGNSFDWVCLRNETSILVVDALTGLVRWKYPLPIDDSASKVVVDEEYILVATGTSVIALSPRFGTQIAQHITLEEFDETLCSDHAHVVFRRLSEDESELHLIWKSPLTGKIMRTMEIEHAAKIQQLTANRLAVIHDNRDVTTVDLTTGELRRYPWAELPASESTSFTWTAGPMTYVEDAQFVYLIHQPTTREMRESMRGRIPNRRMTGFTGIRILDRRTGEHLWEHVLPSGQSGRAVTDQLTLPFLTTIQRPFDPESGKPLGWVRFCCFNKRTGKPLVDSRLPMRFSFDALRINVEANRTIDLTIHGSRVRFERLGFPTIRRPGQ